jgi:hypothetical protein
MVGLKVELEIILDATDAEELFSGANILAPTRSMSNDSTIEE